MAKEKVQKDKQWSTKHTHKTKDRVTRTLHYLVINEGQHGWNCQIKGCVEFVFSVNQNTDVILNILRADCPLHSKYLYHACNRCSVRLYLQLFVGGLMSYQRYLCLLTYNGVQHILWENYKQILDQRLINRLAPESYKQILDQRLINRLAPESYKQIPD